MQRFIRIFLLVSLATLPVWGAVSAEDLATVEAEQAAQEEAVLRAQGKIHETGYEATLQGKYLLMAGQENQRTDIPGIFIVQGRAYQLKLMDDSLRAKLALFNGKLVTLGGKIRNQGKYFIVQEVLTQPDGAFVPARAHTAQGRL